jgi:glycosyltransferase involved in cell wall biosynthesis
MVIVDDCSTDNPIEVISKFHTPRIRYIHLSKRTNYSNAKNVGIKRARAEVLVMLDADDLLLKNGISIRYEKLLQGFDFVHGPCLVLSLDGKKKRDVSWSYWEKENMAKWVHAQGTMYRKKIHSEIGLYDTFLWASSDREMFNRIFDSGYRIGTVDTEVAIYRQHLDQMHRSAAKSKIKPYLKKRIAEIRGKRRAKDFSGLEMLNAT